MGADVLAGANVLGGVNVLAGAYVLGGANVHCPGGLMSYDLLSMGFITVWFCPSSKMVEKSLFGIFVSFKIDLVEQIKL